ncbi:MAG: glycoside hydrolase family 44 protein [Bryobacteraceae bacterium]|jgi:uncharacterized protein (TIGR03437 family)
MSRCVFFFASLLSAVALSAQSAPTLAVDANAARHPISPYIYGINEWPSYNAGLYTDSGMSEAMRVGVRRWGGNNATSYNWQIDVKNNDDDWYFTNYVVGDGVTSTFDVFHERNLQTGTLSLGTVPVMDWTPKLIPGQPLVLGVPLSCSYSVKKYGAQQQVDPYDSDCGNGVLASTGQRIVNSPNDDYQPMTPAFAGQWVTSIMNKYGAANNGGVPAWSLDNEPEWWDNGTHPDIYPNAATYDDMTSRNIATAKAVKAADPTALVTGPVQAGWQGMMFSKKDFYAGWAYNGDYWSNPVDQNAHGGVPWLAYYLQQMQKAGQAGGQRLLDYLDVHAYIRPDALGASAGDAAMETLRLTSTRAFWDPSYILPIQTIPKSGNPCDNYDALCDATGKQVPPQLIRQMSTWVSQDYPGTKLAITEYTWGALDSITGAVAQADILGIFGREGLDLATIWPDIPNRSMMPTDPGAFAFRMFVNYDGNGNQFGETSISATTTNPDTLDIFAAQRSDMALTILVLNKTSAAITDSVSVANFTPAGTLQTFQYSSANLSAIVPGTAAISGNAISATFPAYSITQFVVPQSQSVMTVPQPVINWVNNAASWDASDAVAPGEVVAIKGTSVGTAQLLLAPAGNLPTNLGGVRVLFNGVPAPMIYSAPISGQTQQLAAIVPYEIVANPATTSVNVQVEVQGNRSLPVALPVAAVLPGLFTNDYSGLGQAALLNSDNGVITRNGPSNPTTTPLPTKPATRGSYIEIFATGGGQTTPPGVDGRMVTSILPSPVQSCSVKIGGLDANVTFCGITSGLLQVNAVVPTLVTPGDSVPIQLTIGTVTSRAGVTIVVQ